MCRGQIHVRGVVYDGQTGDGLPGVTVQLKGSDVCTITDAKGLYLISVPNKKATITYSAPGKNGFQIKTGSKIKINIVMNPDGTEPQEVQVGYGTRRSSELTGAVSTISSGRNAPSYMISCVRYSAKP